MDWLPLLFCSGVNRAVLPVVVCKYIYTQRAVWEGERGEPAAAWLPLVLCSRSYITGSVIGHVVQPNVPLCGHFTSIDVEKVAVARVLHPSMLACTQHKERKHKRQVKPFASQLRRVYALAAAVVTIRVV